MCRVDLQRLHKLVFYLSPISLTLINCVFPNSFPHQASSSESMGRWLGVLLAETGSTTDPAALHYDYIDVETTANVIQLAKQSFW